MKNQADTVKRWMQGYARIDITRVDINAVEAMRDTRETDRARL